MLSYDLTVFIKWFDRRHSFIQPY